MSLQERRHIHSVAVELTDRCNLACSHCYNPGRPNGSAPDNQLQLRRLTHLLDTVSVDNITLTGGEPLWSPAFIPAVHLLSSRRVPFQVISNGVLLEPALANLLSSSGVRAVQLSLHGENAAQHDAATGKRSFDRIVAAAGALVARAIPVVGCMVVTHRNATHVQATLNLWRSLGVDRIALSRFSPSGMAATNALDLLPTVPDLMRAFEQAAAVATSRGLRVSCTMPVPPCLLETSDYAPIRFGSCAIGTSMQEFAMGTDGRLRNCALHRTRLTPELTERSDAFWVEGALGDARAYRDEQPPFCVGCIHARTCGGGCGAAAHWLWGGARSFPDPLLWQHVDDEFGERVAALRKRASTHAGRGEGG